MSVGSQALERSALEAKDRESLQQIAMAMGGKPASRAKKADIIDLILELAGVGSGPASEQASQPAAEVEPAADAPAPARKRAAKRAPGAASSDDRPADRADGADGAAPAGAEADRRDQVAASGTGRPAGNRQDANRSAAGGADDDGPSRGEQAPAGDGGNDRSESPAAESSDAGGGEAEPGEGGGGGGPQGPRDDGEPGNRRRRRRGRDRDRKGEGQPVTAGQAEEFLGEPVEVEGLLDLRDEGYGFLRLKGYLPSKEDVYVSVKQVRQFGLRKGDSLKGAARPASRNEKNPALLRIDLVNDADPETNRERVHFDELTAVYPDEALRLEHDKGSATARIIDLVAPLGKGQRGLVVAPPKVGRTAVLMDIASAIEANHPEVHLMVVLLDERPEEATAVRRHIAGEVVASLFDRPVDEHTMVAELALERAERLVEDGRDVVILVDGATRLARAYNVVAPANGRVLGGGLDSVALQQTKKFFGAARNVEEGGSLTILATALVGTGSVADDIVLAELSGAANMELLLDASSSDRRLLPPIDVTRSSTQHDDLLGSNERTEQAGALRRDLAARAASDSTQAALEHLLDRLASCPTNDELLAEARPATPSA